MSRFHKQFDHLHLSPEVVNALHACVTGKGSIITGGLKWVLGNDSPGTTTIDGNTVSHLSITVNEGNPRNDTDCLRIQNQDGPAAYMQPVNSPRNGNSNL